MKSPLTTNQIVAVAVIALVVAALVTRVPALRTNVLGLNA